MVTNPTYQASQKAQANAQTISREIQWFEQVLQLRMHLYFKGKSDKYPPDIYHIQAPDLQGDTSIYANLVKHYQMTFEERLVLILTLLPHISPQSLDVLFSKNKDTERGFTEFGGLKGNSHSGFLPTAETAVFILSGNDLERRFAVYPIFDSEHFFQKHNIIELERLSTHEPLLSGLLTLNEEYLDHLTTGVLRKPKFSTEFPAKMISTDLNWKDLVLDTETQRRVEEVKAWLKYGEQLRQNWGMANKLKPGYKVLFYGPPGTGKTLTACLFGKYSGKPVYRIDLSMVVSKYIGETEKNLEKVFRKAESKDWILFFDEADALFGKRTNIADAHDKYANQEVSYLLQRLEDYNGLVILASNFKENLDDAFARRLQAEIYFPVPQARERRQIWQAAFSEVSTLENEQILKKIADKYEISGGSIMNVVQYSSLMALQRGEQIIREQDILDGIRKEYLKESRSL